MAKSKEQKKEILDRLTSAFTTSPASVFVHFTGLPVGEETQMRSALRSEGVGYFVAKKTLIGKALDEMSVEGERPSLDGEIAIAYQNDDESFAKDSTAPARNIHTFVKKYGDKVSIVGGIFEGGFMDAAQMNEVATIPSVDTLRGMFANVINSPIQGLVVALNAVAEKKA